VSETPRLPRTDAEKDPTTRRMLEEILASEEEHANDLVSLLEGLKD
jgi:bacterioferritin